MIRVFFVTFQVVTKMAVAVECFLHVQIVLCEVFFYKKMKLLRTISISLAPVVTLKTFAILLKDFLLFL